MGHVFDYGRFGAFYGSWLFAIANPAYYFYRLLLEWLAGGNTESTLQGVAFILLFGLIMGFGFGFIGGFVFGLIASKGDSPLIWSLSGMVGGFVVALLHLGFLYRTVFYNPIEINVLILLLIRPTFLMGVMGYLIGHCIKREHPRLPLLDWIIED